jgi:hypothetical protein
VASWTKFGWVPFEQIAWLHAHPGEQRLDSNATVEKILAAWNASHSSFQFEEAANTL